MSATTTPVKNKPATAADSIKSNNGQKKQQPQQQPQEVILRKQLYQFNKKITKREPLDPSYKFLLLQNPSTKAPHIHRDKLYKKFNADLRERVETYMGKFGVENPAMDGRKLKIGRHREDLDLEKMRAAFTMRECKKFEQEGFIQAELEANKARRLRGGMIEEGTRKKKVEAMAMGLQEKERKKKRRDPKLLSSLHQKMLEAEKASLEKKKALVTTKEEAALIEEKLLQKEKERDAARQREIEDEQRRKEIEEAKLREKQRERERIREEREERERMEQERDERMRRQRRMETPHQALQRIYEPMFQDLWDLEFFDGTNPFRIVICAENCAAMGVPDYCDIIAKPMNLTYVKEKVKDCKYETLKEFFDDIELIISNALLYNSDETNPYHKAALTMKKKYIRFRKKVLDKLRAGEC